MNLECEQVFFVQLKEHSLHLSKRLDAPVVVAVRIFSCSIANAEDGHSLGEPFQFLPDAKPPLEIFFASNVPKVLIFLQLYSSIDLFPGSTFPPLLVFP